MISVVFLGADPPTNSWVCAEFSSNSLRLRDTRNHQSGALHIADFVSLLIYGGRDTKTPRVSRMANGTDGFHDKNNGPPK
jgi:hypothetical protein